jgi:hypothetical protein
MSLSPEKSLGYALDRCKFFELVVGAPPDPGWQRDLLLSENKRICVAASRQCGKSAAAQTLCAHEVCFGGTADDPPLVILCAPSLRQSTEAARRVFEAVRLIEGDNVKMQSLTRLETSRGARCIALPQSENVRGLSKVSLAAFDEASRQDDSACAAIRPMLSISNGRLILISTPFGKRGFFWEAWSGESGVWEKYTARADGCSRISRSYLEQEKVALGPFLYSQEFENAWVDNESQFISSDLILAARWDGDGGKEKPWW